VKTTTESKDPDVGSLHTLPALAGAGGAAEPPSPRAVGATAEPPSFDEHALMDEHNASNRERERTFKQANDGTEQVVRAEREAVRTRDVASDTATTYDAIQSRNPSWNESLSLEVQGLIAIAGVDATASYFAAEDLGDSQTATLMFTGLFLAFLVGGVIWLARFHRHKQPRPKNALLTLMAAFVLTLGYLRYDYLVTTSSARYPLVGAGILTLITAASVMAGYFAWRRRESLEIFKARRRAKQADRQAEQAEEKVAREKNRRDILVQSYLHGMRGFLQKKAKESNSDPMDMEAAIRRYLTTLA
jgi:hypothetical protein